MLQALAGLGDLRLYLIRETHRRSLDEEWVYNVAIPPEERGDFGERWAHMEDWKVEGLQRGLVTRSLKDILDALNERPIYKKTISATPFVRSLEAAFRQRISRQQQDAQEFLQVVAERLCDEYHAGCKARKYARKKGTFLESAAADKLAALTVVDEADADKNAQSLSTTAVANKERASDQQKTEELDEKEEGFPMEGKQESQIECLTCGFKPQPKESTFCNLTLNVPHTSSTTLNDCFDGMFKTEFIDDFKCDKCRLLHAISLLEAELRKPSISSDAKSKLTSDIARLQEVLSTDPEKLPEDLPLPDSSLAPKRRIARHTRLTSFPKILAVHLSRSIYDAQMSQKNAAKVSFPERLPLGGLLQQKKYKLLGVVTHKGSHYSGHYESFRRQNVYAPFANPNTFQPAGVYSASTAGTPASTPRIKARKPETSPSPLASTPDLLGPGDSSPPLAPAATITLSPSQDPDTKQSNGPRVSLSSLRQLRTPSTSQKEKDPETSSLRSVKSAFSRIRSSSRSTSRPRSSPNGKTESESGSVSPNQNSSTTTLEQTNANGSSTTLETPVVQTSVKPESTKGSVRSRKEKREKKVRDDRWWRISDDKIQQAGTKDVLDMKQEVYLLFYELEREQGF